MIIENLLKNFINKEIEVEAPNGRGMVKCVLLDFDENGVLLYCDTQNITSYYPFSSGIAIGIEGKVEFQIIPPVFLTIFIDYLFDIK